MLNFAVYFLSHSCHFLPGDYLFWGGGKTAGQIYVYDSTVRSSTEHSGEEQQRHDLQGEPPPPPKKKTKIQTSKVRFGRGKGASSTCWATNGALSEDCWQRQLCPSGLKLEVTKIQRNQWDSIIGQQEEIHYLIASLRSRFLNKG